MNAIRIMMFGSLAASFLAFAGSSQQTYAEGTKSPIFDVNSLKALQKKAPLHTRFLSLELRRTIGRIRLYDDAEIDRAMVRIRKKIDLHQRTSRQFESLRRSLHQQSIVEKGSVASLAAAAGVGAFALSTVSIPLGAPVLVSETATAGSSGAILYSMTYSQKLLMLSTPMRIVLVAGVSGLVAGTTAEAVGFTLREEGDYELVPLDKIDEDAKSVSLATSIEAATQIPEKMLREKAAQELSLEAFIEGRQDSYLDLFEREEGEAALYEYLAIWHDQVARYFIESAKQLRDIKKVAADNI